MRALLSALLLVLLLAASRAVGAAETVLELPARGGVMRVLIAMPEGQPRAAVILIAGGSGRLDIDATGRIGSLAGNQMVRTRGDYAKAGFIAATPDIASDLKESGQGVRDGYRWGVEQAEDLDRLIEHLRALTPKVYLVGTSRGALSIANAAVRLKGARKPDALVITSGLLIPINARQPSVLNNVKPLTAITIPVLLMGNEYDACPLSPARGIASFRPHLVEAPRVDVIMLKGGQADKPGQECEAAGFHGFAGLDAEVVAAITGWLKNLN